MRSDELKYSLNMTKAEIAQMRASVDKLMKFVIEGNGHALMNRVSLLESKMENIEKAADTWKLAAIGSMLSFVGSAVLILMQLLLKH